jgi:outer membrane protein
MTLRASLPLLLFTPLAFAAEHTLPLWEIGVGAAGIRFPDYRGSEQSRQYLLPFPALIYRGDKLKVDRQGVRGLLFDSERVVVDISLDGAVPVDSDQNAVREGMPYLDAVFEIGPSLKISLYNSELFETRFNLPFRYAYSTDLTRLDSHGTLFHPNLSFDYNGLWHLGLSLGPLYASQEYHDYYYSVAPEYVTAARPAYRAEGGYSGMRYTLGWSRRYSGFWLGAFLRYDDLSDAVFSDSPLVTQEDALMGGISFAWFFKQSARRVRVEEEAIY